MTTTKWLAAAALVTATFATPALAQDRMSGDSTRAEMKAQAKQDRMAKRDAIRSQRDRDDQLSYRDDNGRNNNGYWRQSNTGFWPGDVAANVVGGAVTTAGAIATAPFGGYNNGYYRDSYASYDNSWDRSWNNDGGFFGSNAAYTDDVVTAPRTRIEARANNPYASPFNNGSNASNSLTASYAERNGFVCTPGTFYKNTSGRQVLCQ